MSLTKDLLDNPASQTQIDALTSAIKRDMPSINIIDITVPMNTNAEAISARGNPFAIDPATYAARFTTSVHNSGKSVYWRATDCYFEGIYNFPKTNFRNGNKFTFFGDTVTDNFSSSLTRNHGYSLTSPAGNLTNHYLTSQQGGNSWSIASDTLVGPAANGWVRTCLFNANYLSNVTIVAKVKRIGHQQIIIRSSLDSNFPGYGLQMRDTTIRIERPGISNLAEANFTWTDNSWYWMKLQGVGTTIQGKAWLADDVTWPNSTDGSENEPVGWNVSVVDSNQSYGYCGFSGETSFGNFKFLNIIPAIDTQTWMYRSCKWIKNNINIFATGDVMTPFPEASSHFPLTNVGDYNQFFLDQKYCIGRIGTEAGLTFNVGYASHLYTSTIQNSYSSIFNDAGMATYDHYGASIGRGNRFGSFNGPVNSGSETYAVPTGLSELAADKFSFIPEKIAYNQSIDVFIVDKGTGDWTMEIHDSNNNRVQMPDHTNFPVKTTTGIVTIPNASLTSGAYNTFYINWDNPRPDVTYHLHLYSTVADGTVKVTTGHANDLTYLVCNGYKGYATSDALEIDIRKAYEITGVPQFLGEFGDYWSEDASRTNPILSATEHITYIQTLTDAFQRLINDNILQGFCYWRVLGGKEAIMSDLGNGNPYNYQLLDYGKVWQTFFNNNSICPVGTTTSSSTSTTSSSSSSTSTTTLANSSFRPFIDFEK